MWTFEGPTNRTARTGIIGCASGECTALAPWFDHGRLALKAIEAKAIVRCNKLVENSHVVVASTVPTYRPLPLQV